MFFMNLKLQAVKIAKIREKQKSISFKSWQKILPKIEAEFKVFDNDQYIEAIHALNILKQEKHFKGVIYLNLPLEKEGYRLVFLAMEKHLRYLRKEF